MDRTKIAIVILAAGQSKRMGEKNKLLLEFNHIPLYQHILKTVKALITKPFALQKLTIEIVFVTAYEVLLQQAKDCFHTATPFTAVINPQPENGQASSITLALKHISNDVSGIMFCTSDQPFITAECLQKLLCSFLQNKNIIVPQYNGQNTSPCIFPQEFIPELKALTGDIGGKYVYKKHLDRVSFINFTDDLFLDIDTPEDYDKAITTKRFPQLQCSKRRVPCE